MERKGRFLTTQLYLTMENFKFKIDFQIINCTNFDMILGRDFLQKHIKFIDIERNIINCKHENNKDNIMVVQKKTTLYESYPSKNK